MRLIYLKSWAKINFIIFLAFTLVILAYILFMLGLDINSGGNSWKQGDWLINNEIQLVRRGFFGSIILKISDFISINPLFVLGALQGILTVVVFISVIIAVVKLELNARVMWLVISPSFFFLFWFFDPQGSLRKELLVYFSYAILLISAVFSIKKPYPYFLSTAIFIFSVFAHEGNLFFLPFFIFSLYLFKSIHISSNYFYSLAIIVTFGSVLGLFYSIFFSQVPDTHQICEPLLKRGISEHVCKGAIAWLSHDVAYAFGAVKTRIIENNLYIQYLIAYMLSLIPFFFVYPYNMKKSLYYISLVFGIVFLSPLFFVTIDWGRWISSYVTSIAIIVLIHMSINRNFYKLDDNNTIFFKSFIFLHIISWSMSHYCGIRLGFFLFI